MPYYIEDINFSGKPFKRKLKHWIDEQLNESFDGESYGIEKKIEEAQEFLAFLAEKMLDAGVLKSDELSNYFNSPVEIKKDEE